MYNFYKKLPVFAQNFFCTAYGYREKRVRFGKFFDYWMEQLEKMDSFSGSEIAAYQDKKLRELIEEAYENVPYYNRLFRSIGIVPSDIKTKEDLQKLPVTTKEDVRNNTDDFINQSYRKANLIKKKTGGTTGKSLSFFSTEEAVAFQWAVWFRHRSRFGFQFGDKHLNFTVRPVVPLEQSNPPFWRWNQAFNQALINMQMVQENKVQALVNFINENEFNYWMGHPSTIHSFCSILMEKDYQLFHKPKTIFFGAENIYAHQRKDIFKVTGAVLTDQYGFTEGCGNASHCEKLNHHEDFEFGILECIQDDISNTKNEEGAILATGFANLAFPFIRYEVGDYGIWEPDTYQCECGRSSRVLKKIQGRLEDYVITPEGRKVKRFAFLFSDTSQIREAQIVQNRRDEIVINVVKRNSYSEHAEKAIKEKVKNWVSPELEVTFNYMDEIPREENGKFRAIKSNLN